MPDSLQWQILQNDIIIIVHENFFFTHQVNILELSAEGHPSQEMVECLRQIGELSDKHSIVEKNVASVIESQKEIAGELAKVEQALPLKVSREDLNIPDDLQDQLAMLKQGTCMCKIMSWGSWFSGPFLLSSQLWLVLFEKLLL